MAACAEQGILCVLVEMPFNLAVLDVKAADGIQEKYPELEVLSIYGSADEVLSLDKYMENKSNLPEDCKCDE